MSAEHRRLLRRALKVGLAAGLATLAAQLASLPNPWFATLAAIVAIQSTVQATFRSARDSVLGAAIGAVLGLGVATVAKDQAWAVGLVVIATLALGGWVRRETIGRQAALVASVVVLVPEETDLSNVGFALVRFSQAVIGIAVALIVQLAVFPPRAHRTVRRELGAAYRDMARLLDLVGPAIGGDPADADAVRDLRRDVRARMASVDQLWTDAMSEHPNRGALAPHWRVTSRRIWEQCSVLTTEVIEAGSSPLLLAVGADARTLASEAATAMRDVAQRFTRGVGPSLPLPDLDPARAALLREVRAVELTRQPTSYDDTLKGLAVANALNVIAERLVDLAAQGDEVDGITGPLV